MIIHIHYNYLLSIVVFISLYCSRFFCSASFCLLMIACFASLFVAILRLSCCCNHYLVIFSFLLFFYYHVYFISSQAFFVVSHLSTVVFKISYIISFTFSSITTCFLLHSPYFPSHSFSETLFSYLPNHTIHVSTVMSFSLTLGGGYSLAF